MNWYKNHQAIAILLLMDQFKYTSNWNNGSTSTSYYDWFYNWDITTTCVSPRTTFTVNYTTPPALAFSPVSPATTCSNTALPVTVSGTGYTNYAWSNR